MEIIKHGLFSGKDKSKLMYAECDKCACVFRFPKDETLIVHSEWAPEDHSRIIKCPECGRGIFLEKVKGEEVANCITCKENLILFGDRHGVEWEPEAPRR